MRLKCLRDKVTAGVMYWEVGVPFSSSLWFRFRSIGLIQVLIKAGSSSYRSRI